MVKKLYTKSKKKDKKKDEKEENLLNASGLDKEIGGDRRQDVIDEVAGRSTFSYGFLRNCCRTSTMCCLFRCCFRESRDDRMFKTAKKKLGQELDIL
jgi:hypothetical protein